jgi:hypothetical protein
MPGEITELFVSEIELRNPLEFTSPCNGKAKWFRDELGQTWVKFREACPSGEQTVVIPADRIAVVRYDIRDPNQEGAS